MNELMEFFRNQVYRWSIAPFNVVGNTRHMIVSHSWTNSFVWWMCPCVCQGLRVHRNNRCSFHAGGSWTSIISSTKGCSQVSSFATLWTSCVTEGVPLPCISCVYPRWMGLESCRYHNRVCVLVFLNLQILLSKSGVLLLKILHLLGISKSGAL